MDLAILIGLCFLLNKMLKAKGRSPAGYILLLVVLWLGGDVFGAVVGLVLSGFLGVALPDPTCLFIIAACALPAAAAAAAVPFVIVLNLSTIPDEFALREPDYNDRDWRDSDSDGRFGRSDGPGWHDIRTDPNERRRREDERYQND
jgi:hypothetical protein